jgi:hypothetical protein
MSVITWLQQIDVHFQPMAQVSEHVEFFFEELVVGYFENRLPSSPGQYRYMPFRGQGHFRLMECLSSGPARCHYVIDGERHYFVVERAPSLHVLQISG